ncbi:hypothetical protein BJP07_02845 [Corynebacterium sp. NML130628]|nr:hypothetical protein BJP07_02845 [Corynebacterium sp. NML130628]
MRAKDTVDTAQRQMQDLLKTLLARVAKLEEGQEALEVKYNFSLAAFAAGASALSRAVYRCA